MTKTFKIHVDRCVDALSRRGVRMRRTAVAEVLACTFGHENLHVAEAADLRGELDPPEAARDPDVRWDDMLVLRDPVADLPFAVHRSALAPARDSRHRDHCVTPYGNLVDVAAARRGLPQDRPARPSTASSSDGLGHAGALERIVRDGIRRHASYIHVEPRGATYSVFHRRLGIRDLVHEGTIDEYHAVVAQLKARAHLDVTERRVGQEGGFRIGHGNGYVSLRVATVVTVEGEQAIIRILAPDSAELELDGLGITGIRSWRRAISRQNGLCLVCGPAGSGKTTTLNSSIKEIDRFGKKVYTAEDPVEYRIPDVGQVSTDPQVNLTLARSIKNLMRADPDVIVIGELRDPGTARNAVKGADTGHLVLAHMTATSVLHAAEYLRRLELSGHELRYVLRSVLAQNLVRSPCRTCGGRGDAACTDCRGSGYCGRTTVSECASFEEPDLVDALLTASAAWRPGLRPDVPWRTMAADAVDKVVAGATTSDEVLRVVGRDAEEEFERRGTDPTSFSLGRLRTRRS